MEADQKFIEDVVKAIVENPEDVKTERTIDERGVLISLYVNPADMGKIIGKEGKTAKAIRTLLRVFGAKTNARLNLKIVEPEGSERPERAERSAAEEVADDDDVPSDILA
ncbi:MAG: KH domain-containing protein [Patescibacteria group bacterium]